MPEHPETLPLAPVVILCEPQLGENIGTAARAMANFGLSDLRLVTPRDGWPNERARAAASRADHVIDAVQVFDSTEAAIADLGFVFATTARPRDVSKRVMGPVDAARMAVERAGAGARIGILFGRERWGLNNDEIALSDAILTLPVVAEFASLNIAQAVLIMAYEWRKQALGDERWTPFVAADRAPPATKEALVGMFGHLENALDQVNFFRPPEKRATMVRNLRAIFHKAEMNAQEVRTMRGVIAALERRPTRASRGRGADARASDTDARAMGGQERGGQENRGQEPAGQRGEGGDS